MYTQTSVILAQNYYVEYSCLKSGATTEAELNSEVRLKQLMSSDILWSEDYEVH